MRVQVNDGIAHPNVLVLVTVQRDHGADRANQAEAAGSPGLGAVRQRSVLLSLLSQCCFQMLKKNLKTATSHKLTCAHGCDDSLSYSYTTYYLPVLCPSKHNNPLCGVRIQVHSSNSLNNWHQS